VAKGKLIMHTFFSGWSVVARQSFLQYQQEFQVDKGIKKSFTKANSVLLHCPWLERSGGFWRQILKGFCTHLYSVQKARRSLFESTYESFSSSL